MVFWEETRGSVMEKNDLDKIQKIVAIGQGIVVIVSTVGGAALSALNKSMTFVLCGFLIAEIVIIVALITYIVKLKRRNMIKMIRTVGAIHKNFVHKTRDHVYRLKKQKEKFQKIELDSEEGKSEYEDIFEREFNNLRENLQPAVDCISVIISDYLKQNVCTCIKIFTVDQLSYHLLDRNVMTLVRSSNTGQDRISEEDEYFSVTGNTDFRKLCAGKRFYGCGDLAKEHAKGHYNNNSDNWKKKYNSTLVVPIRYKPTNPNPQISNKKMNLLGFLCIDSMNNNEQWEDRESYELQILGLFADTMYIYLDAFVECFEIGGKGSNE